MSSLDKIAQLAALLEDLVKSAESQEHIRLRSDLEAWVKATHGRDFALKTLNSLPNGLRPDVLLWNSRANYLFIGDAKNASNETSSNAATRNRIRDYFFEFARLCREGKNSGGLLAIATNDAGEAAKWVPTLNEFARDAGLARAGSGEPDFKVVAPEGTSKTWIICW